MQNRIRMVTSAMFILLITIFSCKHAPDLQIVAESVKSADRHYSQLSAEKGMNAAFLAMFDSSGVILRSNHYPIEGIGKIRELLESEEDTSFVLTWEPVFAQVAKSGDIGYSYGTYVITGRSDGKKQADGTYATIWKRTGNTWKAILDTGNPGLKPPDKSNK